MSLKLRVDGCKWRKDLISFDKEFIQNYDEDILEVYVDYPNKLQKKYSNLYKCKKLVRNLYDKKTA